MLICVALCLQPEVGSFVAFDHITFWVGNAKQVSKKWEQLQNTPQLIYMSLNKNSVYCVMPRSSKPPDTCK